MKMDKEYYKKMHSGAIKSYSHYNMSLAISRSKGKNTTTIVCPKKAKIKPFLIFNN
jgi:hypothetical protein